MRFEADKDTIFLSLQFIPGDKYHNTHGLLSFTMNSRDGISETYACTISLDDDNEFEVGWMAKRAFYISKKERYVEDAILNGNIVVNPDKILESGVYIQSDNTMMLYVLQCLQVFLDTYDSYEYYDVKFNSMEMYIFRKLSNSIDCMKLTELHGWSDGLTLESPYNILKDAAMSNDISKFIGPNANSSEYKYKYPLIDFSEKEMNFIEDYLLKKMENDVDINMHDYFSTFPYSSSGFRIRINDPEYGECELFITWILDDEKDKCKLIVMDSEDKNHVILMSSIFTDISKFKLEAGIFRKFESLHVGLIQNDNNMINSIDDLKVLDPFISKENCLEFIFKLFGIIIVIHERPQRSKMIRISSKRHTSSQHSMNTSNQDKDFIISRILKPVKDAKEYVSKMNAEHHSSERTYVLEEWPRRGYYRRVHGTDRTVWIEATTCHRHGEISTTKEIKIKL
jgi:hypothetical protein